MIGGITPAVRACLRDVSRSSRYVGLGMRWTLRRQAGFSPDENAAADGEVVWSWRRDRGVYPARLCRHGNGDKKRRSPGRARISRKPLRGESWDVSAVPVVLIRVLSPSGTFAHGFYGRSRRPAFPAPSSKKRDNEIARLERRLAARMRTCVRDANGRHRPA